MKTMLPPVRKGELLGTYNVDIEISSYDSVNMDIDIYTDDVIDSMKYYTPYLKSEYTVNDNRIVCSDGNVFLLLPLYCLDIDIPYTIAGTVIVEIGHNYTYHLPLALVKRTAKTEELFTL